MKTFVMQYIDCVVSATILQAAFTFNLDCKSCTLCVNSKLTAIFIFALRFITSKNFCAFLCFGFIYADKISSEEMHVFISIVGAGILYFDVIWI